MKQILISLILFCTISLQAQIFSSNAMYVFPMKYNDNNEMFEMQSSSIIISIDKNRTIELVNRDMLIDLTIDNIMYENVAGLNTIFYECNAKSGRYILLSISQENEDSYLLSITYEEDNTIVYRGKKWR